MMIIRNNFIPFKGFACINICGILFVRKNAKINNIVINHENIHTKQIFELLIIPFYLIYCIFYIINLFKYFDSHKAYRNIAFEREAYDNQNNNNYLKTRKHYNFIKYFKSK